MTKPRTPQFVLNVIEAKRIYDENVAADKLLAERAQERAWADAGFLRSQKHFDHILALVPTKLRRYLRYSINDQEAVRLGRYPNQEPSDYQLEIPGLAPITVQIHKMCEPILVGEPAESLGYSALCAEEARYANDPEPDYNFNGPRYSETDDLTQALVWAQESATKLIERRAYHRALKLEAEQEAKRRAEQQADYEKREAERRAQQAVADQAEQDEAAKLLNQLRADPVAVHLLKAFLALSRERTAYVEQANALDEDIDSAQAAAEESRARAEKASREARNAWQSAEDAKREASDAEDELRREKRKHKE